MIKTMNSKKVSIEDLENVAGGTLKESSNDSKFLSKLNGDCDRYGTGMIYWSTAVRNEIAAAWEKVGVHVEMDYNKPNRYFIMDKEVSQAEAMKHAQNLEGKHLDPKEWNW